MVHTTQKEDYRWVSQPSIPGQEWQDIAGHIDISRVAPEQGYSLGNTHTLAVSVPLARVLDSYNLHLSAHITFNVLDRHYTILFETAPEYSVLSQWLKQDPSDSIVSPGRIQGLFLLRVDN